MELWNSRTTEADIVIIRHVNVKDQLLLKSLECCCLHGLVVLGLDKTQQRSINSILFISFVIKKFIHVLGGLNFFYYLCLFLTITMHSCELKILFIY